MEKYLQKNKRDKFIFNALELFAKEGMLVTEKRTREDFKKRDAR